MENYPKNVREFVKVRCEQTENNTQIARDVKNKFDNLYVKKEIDIIRRWVSKFRDKEKLHKKTLKKKRLFFDIETTYYQLLIRAWQLKNFQKYFNPDDIVREKEIICISYKWEGDDDVYTLDWRMGEKQMLKKFVKVMGEASESVAHNGDRFDLKTLRTRCIYHGILIYPNYRTLDTLKKVRSRFMFASNKLDYIGKYLGIGGKLEHEGMELWDKVVAGDEKALEKMIQYCERDVIMLEDSFAVLSPYIDHNTNFAVLSGGEKWHCPECASDDVQMHNFYTTPMGVIRREMRCNQCKKQYRISNKTYMNMLIDLQKIEDINA